jgi:hypothetical protein
MIVLKKGKRTISTKTIRRLSFFFSPYIHKNNRREGFMSREKIERDEIEMLNR